MAFSMDVDELNREEVLQPLQPEPEVKEKIETQAESNVKEVMDVDLDSLAQRREITSMIDGFGTDIVRRSSEKTSCSPLHWEHCQNREANPVRSSILSPNWTGRSGTWILRVWILAAQASFPNSPILFGPISRSSRRPMA